MPTPTSTPASTPANTPFVLLIRDGWGRNPNPEQDSYNAVKLARTPVADDLEANWPTTLIATSGEDVGLLDGTMGNSEVGHQNIGAGRIVFQDAVMISKACRDGTLKDNAVLTGAIHKAKHACKAVHLMGINSDAGVHGLLEHLFGLVRLCKAMGQEEVFIHLFTDGRDTGPYSGKAYAERVEAECAKIGVGRVASVIGRYWAMDRDNRWERVKRAYDLMTGHDSATAPNYPTGAEAIQAFYDTPENPGMVGDEFVTPTTVGDAAESRVTDGDSVIFYNYRGDRPREICSAFLLPEFEGAEEVGASPDSGVRGFDRGKKLDLNFVLMSPYSTRLTQLAPVAFLKPPKMVNIAGSYLSGLGLTQFRCAETEKYPHVTFFFNDYRDEPFEGEHREIIQSPRVATYDMQPEMSARGVADAVLRRLDATDREDVIVVNFANADMVGHTGSLPAAITACETVDALTGEIMSKTLARGGTLIITADHGNAEQMFNPETNAPHTSHTTYTVPVHVVGKGFEGRTLRDGGRLADILPTALAMMGLGKPVEMTGESLLA